MVAARAPQPNALPLLFPPDKPPRAIAKWRGWRWTARSKFTVLERCWEDDEQGALVQRIVLRYYRDGVLRKELAREYGYSERRVQDYLSGNTSQRCLWYLAYSMPVLRVLGRLGFPVDHTYKNRRRRLESQVAACRRALADLAILVENDQAAMARRLREDIALLTVEVPS